MTLKEGLEILRGCPIKVFEGNPLDIPCIETSDAERLCKTPVVSVAMLAYKHEPFIRRAIEGVMMQQTDFEFELVVGEDGSPDKTREICFELQKRHPDKIRVLWWHENISKFGGNGRRVRSHCRGEFIALCEGDDYWTDPLKLQKQVDAMRKNPNVGLCFTDARVLQEETGQFSDWPGAEFYEEGVIKGDDFFRRYCYGVHPEKGVGPEGFVMTASVLYRQSVMEEARAKFDILSWRLLLGDKTRILALASLSDVCFIREKTAVYRMNAGGAMSRHGTKIFRDSAIVKMYFAETTGLGRDLPRPISWLMVHVRRRMDDRKTDMGDEKTFRRMVVHWLEKVPFNVSALSVPDRIRLRLYLAFGWKWPYELRPKKLLKRFAKKSG